MAANRIYAIGDIHGHLDRLRSVHDWIDEDRRQRLGQDVVVHVGDLVDRGPDSAGVIQFLIDGLAGGQPWVVLLGNHDRMMLKFLTETDWIDPRLRSDFTWLHERLGGSTTLASYGISLTDIEDHAMPDTARKAVPAEHVKFLTGLDTMYRTDNALFVHAGIRPGVEIEDQIEDDLIWIREPFLSDVRDYGPLIVHGHTPVEEPIHYGNRVNIDSGVAFGGPLTAIVVEGRDVWNLTASGRVPLLPTKAMF